MNPRDRRFLLGGLLAAALHLGAMLTGASLLALACKPIPVLLLAAWLRPATERESRPVALGLVLSALGDLLLGISADWFVAGLVAFLLAHLAYIAAFLSCTRTPAPGYALPVAAFGVLVFLWLQPRLGGMLLPVLAYVVVICLMMWRAWALVATQDIGRRAAWCAALGASSFGVSDMLVAWNRFVAPVLTLQFLLMLLYWAGQWGIAASARAPRSATAPDRR